MKITAAIIIFVGLAALVVGDGWVRTRRAETKTQTLRAVVAAMSPQELAIRVQECEPTESRAPAPAAHDAAYCAEIMQVVDNQPLQIVTAPPTAP